MKFIEDLAPHCAEWSAYLLDVGLSQPLRVEAFLCRGAAVEPLALITAGVHGDEYEGPDAVAALSRALAPERMAGSVCAVPIANPMAFAAAQRLTPADGLNLARCFPGRADGSATERLARWLFDQLASRATHLIDLHSGGVAYRFLPMAGFYGLAAAGSGSFDAARRFGLDHLWRLPETDGVLSCELWKRGITAIGCEYLGSGQLSAAGSRAYVRGVISCLAHWGIVDPGQMRLPTGQAFAGDWSVASVEGVFRATSELGRRVAPGDFIAEIVDARGRVLQRFVSPSDGILLGLRSKAHVCEGNWGVLIGTPAEPNK